MIIDFIESPQLHHEPEFRRIVERCKSYNCHIRSRSQWRFKVMQPVDTCDRDRLHFLLPSYNRNKKVWLDFSMDWFPACGTIGCLPFPAIDRACKYYISENGLQDGGVYKTRCIELQNVVDRQIVEIAKLRKEVHSLSVEMQSQKEYLRIQDSIMDKQSREEFRKRIRPGE